MVSGLSEHRIRALGVTLTDFDPAGEDKVLAAICYTHTNLPEAELFRRVRKLSAEQRA